MILLIQQILEKENRRRERVIMDSSLKGIIFHFPSFSTHPSPGCCSSGHHHSPRLDEFHSWKEALLKPKSWPHFLKFKWSPAGSLCLELLGISLCEPHLSLTLAGRSFPWAPGDRLLTASPGRHVFFSCITFRDFFSIGSAFLFVVLSS